MKDLQWATVLLALILTSTLAAAQASIPVVHTWGDLQNASKLTTVPSPRPDKDHPPPKASPVTFQLGIEATEATSYGGVLLYFLAPDSTDGDNPPASRGLYVIQLEGPTPSTDFGWGNTFPERTATPGTVFQAQTISFGAAGDYVVKIVKPIYSTDPQMPMKTGDVLASVTVHVKDRPEDLWYPFWETKKVNTGASSGPGGGWDADKVYAIVPVHNPKGGAAVPMPSRAHVLAQLPASNEKLPSLYPDLSDAPAVRLKVDDHALRVHFDQKIEGFFPEDNFLTRWWVNDKPVNFDPALVQPAQARALAAEVRFTRKFPMGIYGSLVWYTRQVLFELKFQPTWLVVKPGDRVGVQLLFCPNGYQGLNGTTPCFTSDADEGRTTLPPSAYAALSNRIDFIYSGYPGQPFSP